MSKPSQSRQLFRYDFEGGAFVSATIVGDVETADALDMLEELIARKRAELARLQERFRGRTENGCVQFEPRD